MVQMTMEAQGRRRKRGEEGVDLVELYLRKMIVI